MSDLAKSLLVFGGDVAAAVIGGIIGSKLNHEGGESHKKLAELLGQKIGQRVSEGDTYRGTFVTILGRCRSIDRIAHQGLMRMQINRNNRAPRLCGNHEPYRSGDEEIMVFLLGRRWHSMPEDEALQEAKVFGRMSPENLDEVVEAMYNDVWLQRARRVREIASDAVNSVNWQAAGNRTEALIRAFITGR